MLLGLDCGRLKWSLGVLLSRVWDGRELVHGPEMMPLLARECSNSVNSIAQNALFDCVQGERVRTGE